MTFLSALATIFGTLMALANFPQAIKIFQRKSVKDISILSFSVIFIGALIWIVYGIENKSFPLILSNIIGAIAVACIIFGWALYR